jgi:hypothetical protein
MMLALGYRVLKMSRSNGKNALLESVIRSIVTARRQRFGKRTGEVRTDLDRLDRDVLKLWTINVSSTTSTNAQYQALSTATLQTLAGKNRGNGSDNLNQDRS